MVKVRLFLRATQEPLKRTPVAVELDADGRCSTPVLTDRDGVALFDIDGGSGKVLVSGIERYHGHLDGEIPIGLGP